MSIATAQATATLAPASARRRAGLLERIYNHRADYLYVLPALLVMLVVIAYPIYYTIELSFFKTPANLQMKDKVWVGFDNYVTVLTSKSFRSVTINTLIWTVFSTGFAFLLGLGAALCAEPRVRRPRRAAGAASHPLCRQRGRRLLRLEVALPLRLRRHRRARRPARPDRRADQLPRQRLHRAALADRREHLEGVLLRDGDAARRAADGARSAPARGAGRRRERLEPLLARHLPASEGRVDRHHPSLDGRELQFLHHPLGDDRRRAGRRIGHLDHADLHHRVRTDPLRARVGLFGAPLHHHDDARLLLREGADPRRRVRGPADERHLHHRPAPGFAESRSTGGAGRDDSSSSSSWSSPCCRWPGCS